jgi:hypothetical protein
LPDLRVKRRIVPSGGWVGGVVYGYGAGKPICMICVMNTTIICSSGSIQNAVPAAPPAARLLPRGIRLEDNLAEPSERILHVRLVVDRQPATPARVDMREGSVREASLSTTARAPQGSTTGQRDYIEDGG